MTKTFDYFPKGVCSAKMSFVIEDDIIKSFKVLGGCNGNLQGIGKLIEGMKIDEVIAKLENIKCGMKQTSCPDQIAKALKSLNQ